MVLVIRFSEQIEVGPSSWYAQPADRSKYSLTHPSAGERASFIACRSYRQESGRTARS